MRCLIYSRVSTSDQHSENQVTQLREYAERQGWTVTEAKTDIVSGAKSLDERQGLKDVFELARRKKFDILLFWSLDRFSREGSRKTLEYLTTLDSYNVKWHSFTESYISSLGVFADAIISLLSCLAKQERVRISERTMAGLERVKAKGVTLGRPQVKPEVVQRAKELRDSGMSFSAIGNEMQVSKSRAFQLCIS